MSYSLRNAQIIVESNWHKKQYYDVANEKIMCQFDGCGNISRYSIANRFPIFNENSFYSTLMIGHHKIEVDTPKQVEMIGRNQVVLLNHQGVNIKVITFIDRKTNAIFIKYQLNANHDTSVQIDFGYLHDMKNYQNYYINQYEKMKDKDIEAFHTMPDKSEYKNRTWYHEIIHDYKCEVSCSETLEKREFLNFGYHYSLHTELNKDQDKEIDLVITAYDDSLICDSCDLLLHFEDYYQDSLKYIHELKSHFHSEDETLNALFVSSLNCALSSYKEIDDFKGFFAGINYQSPARTYYRDGYFTCLPLLKIYPDLVRKQIITISYGVNEKGQCPSGLIAGNKNWWDNHLDSPQFYTLLVYEYLKETKDFSILGEKINQNTILDLLLLINDQLISQKDENHLLYRAPYIRNDWADNVYRCGYITYIEALYYQSVYAMSQILKDLNKPYQYYEDIAIQIKNSINDILWDDELGYYLNYMNEEYKETNLSIDTILTVLFDIADEKKKKRILDHMEQMLETKNNQNQLFGDWGTMCVYPFYSIKSHVVEKSSYDYVYHNGSDWPYLSSLYAYVKKMNGREYGYPLTRWFTYSLEEGWYTPVEYYNPITKRGSLLQGWSAMAVYTLINN